MPTVSVIIPLYQGERTICRALDSVVAQSFTDFEIIVSDDGSNDGAMAVMRARCAQEPRLVVLEPAANAGPSVARNRAIDAAKGTWLALLDADDAWRPDRLRRMLQDAEHADFIADELIGYDAVAEAETGPLHRPLGVPSLTLTDLLRQKVDGRPFSPGLLKPLMRKNFLDEHALRYDADVRHGEDVLLYTEALMLGARFRLCDAALYVYTTPYGAVSGKRSPHTHSGRNGRLIAARLRALRQVHAPRLSAPEQGLLDRRITEFEQIEDWWALEVAWRAGHRRESAALLARSGYIRRRLLRGAVRRLLGR